MSEFLTPSGLAEKLVQKTGVSMEVAKNFSTVFFRIVKTGLKNSESFSVYNFGTFKKTWIEATIGLNPSNGEKIDIPAHWRIKFVPCASVARRINRPYAHLKAKVLPEDTVIETAPSRYDSQEEDDEEQDIIEESELNIENSEEEKGKGLLRRAMELEDEKTIEKEEIASEEQDVVESKKGAFKFFTLAILGLVLLILLIVVLARSCTSDKKKETKVKPKVQPVAPIQVEPKAESVTPIEEPVVEEPIMEESIVEEPVVIQDELTIEQEEQLDFEQAEMLFSSYAVPNGSDYHTIAEEQYGNRHLWPILYSANKDEYADPDLIDAYNKIKIPKLMEGKSLVQQIESSVLQAYNGYLLMCEKQPDSSKNDERKRLAVRVLVSGEILSPGFIDAHSARILPEYASLARNIVKNQYR